MEREIEAKMRSEYGAYETKTRRPTVKVVNVDRQEQDESEDVSITEALFRQNELLNSDEKSKSGM